MDDLFRKLETKKKEVTSKVIKRPGIRPGQKCSTFKHPTFTLKPHQKYVYDNFLTSKHKGFLLFHKLGSGKTCLSISIADKMLKTKQINKVYVLSPGSLRNTWITEYCRVCGLSEEYMEKYFVFVTYNYNIIKYINTIDFNKSLVIIDEVHNLVNGKKNNTKNAVAIYDKIVRSNCRVLALSGTPIYDSVDEWELMFNLLRNDKVTDKYNAENLQGIISYYPGNVKDFPRVIYNPPIKVKLADEHALILQEIYNSENDLIKQGPPDEKLRQKDPEKYKLKKIMYTISVLRIRSRAVSNVYYPGTTVDDIDLEYALNASDSPLVKQSNDLKDKIVEMKQSMFLKLPDILDTDSMALKVRELNDKGKEVISTEHMSGWISDKTLANKKLLSMSPKFTMIIYNILKNIDTKHALYSFYLNKSGIRLLHTLLTKCGIKTAIFSGSLNDTGRRTLLEKYNSKHNSHGEKIKVLMITDAGAEGITLKDVNNLHIVESSVKGEKTNQVIGRGARMGSHNNLPEDERYINIWRYWSVSPFGNILVDEYLYDRSLIRLEEKTSFINEMIENSIENIENIENIGTQDISDN